MSLDEVELGQLKARIAALREAMPSRMAEEMGDLLEAMAQWFADVDDQIAELDSRVRYFEEHEYLKDK